MIHVKVDQESILCNASIRHFYILRLETVSIFRKVDTTKGRFRCFKRGSYQLLAKVCARSTGLPLRTSKPAQEK